MAPPDGIIPAHTVQSFNVLISGDILEVLLDEGESVRNVPASFADQGQEVLEVKNVGDHFCLKVRRKK